MKNKTYIINSITNKAILDNFISNNYIYRTKNNYIFNAKTRKQITEFYFEKNECFFVINDQLYNFLYVTKRSKKAHEIKTNLIDIELIVE